MVFKATGTVSIDQLLQGMSLFDSPAILPREHRLYPCVADEDQEPVGLIQPDIDHGPWIAGGAALQWYQRQCVGLSDIDVFCCDEQQALAVIERIKSHPDSVIRYRTANAVTFELLRKGPDPDWRIQIIIAQYYADIESVLDNFDITVCKIGTAGQEWRLGPTTARDVREGVLRMIQPPREGAVKRLIKYWTYGYEPVEGLVESIADNSATQWVFNSDEDYR
jgi:hypothetical protein